MMDIMNILVIVLIKEKLFNKIFADKHQTLALISFLGDNKN